MSQTSQTLTKEQIAVDQALAAEATNFSDVLYYANECPDFKPLAADAKHSVYVFNKAVECSPINMMRATAIMPCAPAEFVRYMEPDARVLWDEHYKYGRLVRRVGPIASESSEDGATSSAVPSTSTKDFPQLKIFEFNSPVPSLVRGRDFEMVMCQRVNTLDGTAVVKGFSTPKGYLLPLRYKSGSEREGEAAEKALEQQRVAQFKDVFGVDISNLQSPSLQKVMAESQKRLASQGPLDLASNTSRPPPDGAKLPGMIGLPVTDTSSLEATVRGTILFSGFVALPIFEDDTKTLDSLPPATRKLIRDAEAARAAAGPLPAQSTLFAYPYATSVGGRRIIASKITYVALIKPQGNVHPLLVNVVVRLQSRGLRQMQRIVATHPVKVLDARLEGNKGGDAAADILSKL